MPVGLLEFLCFVSTVSDSSSEEDDSDKGERAKATTTMIGFGLFGRYGIFGTLHILRVDVFSCHQQSGEIRFRFFFVIRSLALEKACSDGTLVAGMER
jgi:hypothetical protein